MNAILDVGAADGNSLDYWSSRKEELLPAKLFLFEPSPRHWQRLLDKASHFSVGAYEIILCPFGLGKFNSTQPFYPKDDQYGDSFDPELHRHDGVKLNNLNMGFSILAHTMCISKFITQNTNLDDSLYIKLDCEGAEYGILESMLDCPYHLKMIKEIQVEYHWPFTQNDYRDEYAAKGIDIKPWRY